jgi:hypothetical protein
MQADENHHWIGFTPAQAFIKKAKNTRTQLTGSSVRVILKIIKTQRNNWRRAFPSISILGWASLQAPTRLGCLFPHFEVNEWHTGI